MRGPVALLGAALFSARVALTLTGCRQAERPPCSAPALGLIEAEYTAEALKACRGQTVDACAALPAIEAKYAAKREEWVRCR